MDTKKILKNATLILIWSVFYILAVRLVSTLVWNFNPLRFDHWQYIYDLWNKGWVISSANDWSFLFTLLLSLPLWYIGFNVFKEIHFTEKTKNANTALKAYIKTIKDLPSHIKEAHQKAKEAVKPKEEKKEEKKETLTSLPTFNIESLKHENATSAERQHKIEEKQKVMETTPAIKTEKKETAEEKPYTPPALSETDKHKLEEAIKELQKMQSSEEEEEDEDIDEEMDDEDDNENLNEPLELPPPPPVIFENILSKNGNKVIKNKEIAGNKIEFIGVSENKITLLNIDYDKEDWLADEKSINNRPALWFAEDKHMTSPVHILNKAREKIKENLPKDLKNMKIECAYCITRGSVLNAKEMENAWKKQDVHVIRFGIGGPRSLQNIVDLLPSSKEKEAPKELFEKITKIIEKL